MTARGMSSSFLICPEIGAWGRVLRNKVEQSPYENYISNDRQKADS